MTFKAILKYFLIWQVTIVFVSSAAGNFLPLSRSDTYLGGGIAKYLGNPLLNSRSNFDGVHYVLIATHGYNFGQQAFFPLYPDLIRLSRSVVENPILGGTLISILSFLVGLVFLDRLIRLDYPARVSFWTIVTLLAFPASFFFSAVYTEGLFFLLIISSFYFARKSNWLLAGILGGLASYTRLVGVFLFPALLIELWSQYQVTPRSWQKTGLSVLKLLLIPAGLLLYMKYLHETTGDPLAFYHVQKLFGQNRSLILVLPYQVYWRYLKMLTSVAWGQPFYFTLLLEFVSGAVFFLLTTISVFRQRFSYAVFCLFAFAVPMLTGNFVSLPRYVLVCFPAFIIIAQILSRFRASRLVIIPGLILLNITALILFIQGYWVA